MKKFIGNSLALAGLIIITTVLLAAILAPIISPYDPNFIDIESILIAPSYSHIMGTDGLGRDVFSRMLYGAQISLLVGFVAVGISTGIGIILGSIAGFYRGWVDSLIMRIVDIVLSIPSFFLILAVIAFLTPSIWNIMIVIGLTSWMGVTRLVRAEFLSLRGREYVMASEAMGSSDIKIILLHLLLASPNTLPSLNSTTVFGLNGSVLLSDVISGKYLINSLSKLLQHLFEIFAAS